MSDQGEEKNVWPKVFEILCKEFGFPEDVFSEGTKLEDALNRLLGQKFVYEVVYASRGAKICSTATVLGLNFNEDSGKFRVFLIAQDEFSVRTSRVSFGYAIGYIERDEKKSIKTLFREGDVDSIYSMKVFFI